MMQALLQKSRISSQSSEGYQRALVPSDLCQRVSDLRFAVGAAVVVVCAVAGCTRRVEVPEATPASLPHSQTEFGNERPGSERPGSERPGSERPEIRLSQHTGSTKATFEVMGLKPAALTRLAELAKSESNPWPALFAVYVERETLGAHRRPAVLGSYVIKGDRLCFEPRFPLRPGVCYQAVFYAWMVGYPTQVGNIVAEFTIPRPPAAATTVVDRVYPSASLLPENQLKFYLHFSAPMSRGEAYRHIHLLQATEKEIDLPFLELDEELWDPQAKRFTLFFDPGRIKRGLKPREEVGPVLEEGKSYTLVIDSQWPDAQGNPLKAPHRKRFEVGPPEDRAIDIKEWRLQTPAAGTKVPLLVRFPRPLDHALLERILKVTAPDGITVAGTIAVTDEEKCWQLTPRQPWIEGPHKLVADKDLEDLAGNRIGQPFEIDVFRTTPVRSTSASIPFAVRPGLR